MAWVSMQVGLHYTIALREVPVDIYSLLSGVFRKLLPLAAAHNLRIVCLYRRDYDPTTSFCDRDLADLTSGTVEGQEGFVRSQAVEIATFLVKFALEQRLPPARGTSGGIALIGWSMGALHTHAVVAYLDALASDVLSDLGKYSHTMASHGEDFPPSIIFKIFE
jgi:pimeloyl-ACP methyl ester carboxylesterase